MTYPLDTAVTGPRFTRPSEVIERLRYARGISSKDSSDFRIFGAGDFDKAMESGKFVPQATLAIYVMLSNGASSLVTDAGFTITEATHQIDVVLYAQSKDNRSQYNDQMSVWFKEFLIWAIQGFYPFEGGEPLYYAGDQLSQVRGSADYMRVYQFAHQLKIDAEDVLGGGDADDLPDFLQMFNTFTVIAPPTCDESDPSGLDLELRT